MHVPPPPQAEAEVRHMSAEGLAFLDHEEGGFRLKAYLDSGGTWTICEGHTGKIHGVLPGPGVTATAKECKAVLGTDLGVCEAELPEGSYIPQNAIDSMVSFCFNVGVGLFRESQIALLVAGDYYTDAALAMLHHSRVGKMPYALLERRWREAQLMLYGRYR